MTATTTPAPSTAPSTALLTDHYELTMLQAALRSGAASRRCVFEVFARRLPDGRRYGVVAGVGLLSLGLMFFARLEEVPVAVNLAAWIACAIVLSRTMRPFT